MKTEIQLLVGKKLSHVEGKGIFQAVVMPEPELIDDESYVELLGLGVSMVLPDGETIAAVQLHSENHEGYSQFSGEIPAGISFAMNRGQVRNLLGLPVQSGGGGNVVLLGPRPAWDAYKIDEYRLHVEYADDNNSIRLITISTQSTVVNYS